MAEVEATLPRKILKQEDFTEFEEEFENYSSDKVSFICLNIYLSYDLSSNDKDSFILPLSLVHTVCI